MDLKVQRNISLFRPFTDLRAFDYAHTLKFYTNASKTIGFGAVSGDWWMYGKWDPEFIAHQELSIEFLELYALCVGIITRGSLLQNTKIIIFFDNEAVVHMVNNLTSRCPHCMKLIRQLIFDGLVHNRRVLVKHVRTFLNIRADALSQLQFQCFWDNSPPSTHLFPDQIHPLVNSVEEIWFNDSL